LKKKFKDIEKEIEKLVREGERNDRQTNALNKNILNINAEIVELEARKVRMEGTGTTASITDPEMIAYNTYKATIDTLIQSVTNDTNKTNKYDARLSIGNNSITGSELRCNILFNFIKEYFEIFNTDEIFTYLHGKGVAMTFTQAEQKAKFDNIVKYTKDVAIPSDKDNSDLYKTNEDEKLLEKHYFRRLHDKPVSGKKRKKIWEVGGKFKTERLIFPYRDFFELMDEWFKDGVGDGTIRANNYPAFTDEDTNPFKKVGLLNKKFDLVFDPTDETSKKDWIGETANIWYVNNETRRKTIEFKNFQDVIVEFYSFFLPKIKTRF